MSLGDESIPVEASSRLGEASKTTGRLAYLLKAAGVGLATLVIAPIVIVASFLDRDARFAYRIALGWMKVNLWLAGVEMNARGLENVSPSAQYIFMSNHLSSADIVVLGWTLRRFQLRWVAKKELAQIPVFGWGLRALGNIVIDRSDREQAIRSYATGREKARRGLSIMIFPEGARGLGAELLPFKKGGFVFALETGLPIVPVGLANTQQILPKKSWKTARGRVEIAFGKPIPTVGRTVEDRDRLMEEVRVAIDRLAWPERPQITVASGAGRS